MIKVVQVHFEKRAFEPASEVITLAKQKSMEAFDPNHPLYLKTVYLQGRLLFMMRKYAEAEPIVLELKEAQARVIGQGVRIMLLP